MNFPIILPTQPDTRFQTQPPKGALSVRAVRPAPAATGTSLPLQMGAKKPEEGKGKKKPQTGKSFPEVLAEALGQGATPLPVPAAPPATTSPPPLPSLPDPRAMKPGETPADHTARLAKMAAEESAAKQVQGKKVYKPKKPKPGDATGGGSGLDVTA